MSVHVVPLGCDRYCQPWQLAVGPSPQMAAGLGLHMSHTGMDAILLGGVGKTMMTVLCMQDTHAGRGGGHKHREGIV